MSSAEELTQYFEGRETEMLDALAKLVDLESPSEDLSAIEDFALTLQMYVAAETGADAQVVRSGPYKRPHVIARLGERSDVLFIGHFDTVYPLGASQEAPFRIEDGKAFGAGVLDMKSGVVIMTEVAKYIAQQMPSPNLTLFFNSDEELAMFDSVGMTRELAAEAQTVIVFEFTADESEVKIGSRGSRPYSVTVHGRGGHAAYPDLVSNPIDGIAEVIAQLREVNRPEIGQVAVATVVNAGERTNVIPESATVSIDVRYGSHAALEAIENKLASITFHDPDLKMTYEIEHDIPLFVADPTSQVFSLTRECAAEFGIDMRGIEARGSSDLNNAGPVNPNSLEALGACGGGAHSVEREYIFVSSLARRAALSAMVTERALASAKDLENLSYTEESVNG